MVSEQNSKFAPAGYGLGVSSLDTEFVNTPEELDELSVNQWYIFTGGNNERPLVIAGTNINYAWGRVDTYNGNNAMMTLHVYQPTAFRHCELVRYKDEGVWGDWEWVNPPMHLDAEYRTTEMCAGKPVYTMAVNFGTMPNSTHKILVHGISNIERVISCTGSSSDGCCLPYHTSAHDVDITANTTDITIKTTTNWSNCTAHAVLKYTKITD